MLISKKEAEVQKALGSCNFIKCAFCQKDIADFELNHEAVHETLLDGTPAIVGFKYTCPKCGARIG